MNVDTIQLSLGVSKLSKKMIRCLCRLVLKGLTVFRKDENVFTCMSKIIDLQFLEEVSGRNLMKLPDVIKSDPKVSKITEKILSKENNIKKYILDTLSQSLLKMSEILAKKDNSKTIKMKHIRHCIKTSLFDEIIFGIELFFQKIYIYSDGGGKDGGGKAVDGGKDEGGKAVDGGKDGRGKDKEEKYLVYGGGTFLQKDILKKTCRWSGKEKVWVTKKIRDTIKNIKTLPKENIFIVRKKTKTYSNAPDSIKNSFGKFLHINTLYKGKSRLTKSDIVKKRKQANKVIKDYFSKKEDSILFLKNVLLSSVEDSSLLFYYIFKNFGRDLSETEEDSAFVRKLSWYILN